MWVRVPPPSLPRKGLLWLCERLKGNMRRELRNEKYPFNCTDFASPNLRIYTPVEDTALSLYRYLFFNVPIGQLFLLDALDDTTGQLPQDHFALFFVARVR